MLRGDRLSASFAGLCAVALSAVSVIGCAGGDTGAGGSAATGGTNGATATNAAVTAASGTTQAATSGATTGTGMGFPCSGQPLPTTAPATINVGGNTVTVGLGGQQALPDVAVEVFVGASATPVATTTSNAQAAYTFPLNTGGTPLDGYIHGTKATYMDTYLYPPSPLAADQMNASVLVISSNIFSLLQNFASVTQTAGNGFIGIVVSDCSQMPVGGATVTTVPAGTVRYNVSNVPSNTAMTTDIDGVAYVFNLPPGTVTVQATANGTPLRQHDIMVRADVVTTTAILP
jgi:hypothetical protein